MLGAFTAELLPGRRQGNGKGKGGAEVFWAMAHALGLGFRVWGLGLGVRVQGLGFGFRVRV